MLRKPLHFLVIEDYFICQQAIKSILSVYDVTCDLADRCALGLLTLNERHHGVLLDLHLPDGHGLEVVKAIRARKDVLRHIPIIICSSSTEDVAPSVRESLHIDAVLSKPFTIEQCKQILAQHFLTPRKQAS